MVVWTRAGRAAKSVTAAAGSRVSRPEVAGLVLASGAGPPAQQPAESFLAQDVADDGAAQRCPFPGEPGAHLVNRQPLAAQFDDPGAGGVLPRGALAAGDAGRGSATELRPPAGRRVPATPATPGCSGAGLRPAAARRPHTGRRAAPRNGAGPPARPAAPSPAAGRYRGHGADLSQPSGGER